MKNKVSRYQVKQELKAILNLDINQDFKMFHNLVMTYLETINLDISKEINEDITNYYLNGKVTDFILEDFLFNYTNFFDGYGVYENNYYLSDEF